MRSTTKLGLTVLAAGALAFAGASIVVAQIGDDASDDPQAPPDRGSVALTRTVKDPGGGKPWTVRTHTRGGERCFHVGRVDDDGAFGHETARGFVRKSPTEGGGGPCGPNKRRDAFFLTYDKEAGDGGRTSAYGMAASGTRAVNITVDGETTRVTPAADGTFLAVFEGIHTGADTKFNFERDDGSLAQPRRAR